MTRVRRMLQVCLLAAVVFAAASVSAAPALDPTGGEQADRYVSIDFNNVDINVFIKFISELTGRNFVVDDRVKGKVTILSPSRITIDEAYRVFESVLEVHGYTTVKSGQIIKIVPSPDARSKSIETLISQEAGMPEDKVVTQLIPLRYADTAEIKRLFAPLVSKSSVILDYTPTNTLIVTDVYSNILRLQRILETIDIKGIGQEISLIPILHADAVKTVQILDSIFKQQKPKKGEPAPIQQFVADERTNTLIVLASEDDTARIKSLIVMLDKEVPRGEGGIRVYYLEYAVAEDLAKVLQSLAGKEITDTPGQQEMPAVSEKVQVTADPATNTLIIQAGKEDYLILEDIVRKLDIPRSMVYIEALFMEVDAAKEFNIGVEWQAAQNTVIANKNAVVGGSYKNETTLLPGLGLEDIANFLSPGGLSLGVFTEAINIGGVTFSNIQALVRAFSKDSDVNILSTPQILTTDNEEAKITVGKNVPFQTRTSVDTNSETYNSFEYRDVGKTLKIKPQISKGRQVRLEIYLEITQLETESALVQFRPTTLKRTIETTALVEDSNTIVIGGLIDDSSSKVTQKVPCLGDIPFFKWAFRSQGTSSDKTNLYIFLTPHVIKNPAEAAGIYDRKKEEMESIKGGSIKMFRGEDDSSPPATGPILVE